VSDVEVEISVRDASERVDAEFLSDQEDREDGEKKSLHLVFPQQEIIKGLFFVIFLMIRGCLLFTSALIFDVYISLFMYKNVFAHLSHLIFFIRTSG